jgi:hypothetical protein
MDCVATANLHRLALRMALPVSRNKSHARVRAGNQADGSPDRMIISPGISHAFVEANTRQSPPCLGSNRTQRRPDHRATDGPGDPAHAAHGNYRVQIAPPPALSRVIGQSGLSENEGTSKIRQLTGEPGHTGGASPRDPLRSSENRHDLNCRSGGMRTTSALVKSAHAQDPAYRPSRPHVFACRPPEVWDRQVSPAICLRCLPVPLGGLPLRPINTQLPPRRSRPEVPRNVLVPTGFQVNGNSFQ